MSKRNYLNSLMSLKWKHWNGICFYRIYATLEKGLTECGTLLTFTKLSPMIHMTITLCLTGCKIINTPPKVTANVVNKAPIHIWNYQHIVLFIFTTFKWKWNYSIQRFELTLNVTLTEVSCKSRITVTLGCICSRRTQTPSIFWTWIVLEAVIHNWK